jgi:hypothetical protein
MGRQPILHPPEVLIRHVELLLGSICDSRSHLLELLLVSVNHDFQLNELIIFLLLSLIICFHTPLDNLFDLELQGHSIIVDGVKNHGVGDATRLVHLKLYLLVLLLAIVLDHFDSLNDDVLEDTLTLFYINCVLICVLV